MAPSFVKPAGVTGGSPDFPKDHQGLSNIRSAGINSRIGFAFVSEGSVGSPGELRLGGFLQGRQRASKFILNRQFPVGDHLPAETTLEVDQQRGFKVQRDRVLDPA